MNEQEKRMNFMANLRAERLKKGLTQNELAQKANIEKSLICKYEKCKALPREDTLKRITNVLGCNAEDLMGHSVHLGGITNEELLECAEPLMKLLQSKGDSMMFVQVTTDSADLFRAEVGVKKHPCD